MAYFWGVGSGEAEKSHQKARQRGFTECWTVVNVGRLDMVKAKGESPSTDRFYSLKALVDGQGEEYEDFRRRIISLNKVKGIFSYSLLAPERVSNSMYN